MRAAQVQITNYFVSELQFTANRSFDVSKPSVVTVDDLQVHTTATAKDEERADWQITLRVALDAPPDQNAPYSFLLEMIGFIHVDESVSEDRTERFARINGTSLVFSAAREIVKAATARGPFPPLLLPTVTFWEPKRDAPEKEPTSAVVGGTSPTGDPTR